MLRHEQEGYYVPRTATGHYYDAVVACVALCPDQFQRPPKGEGRPPSSLACLSQTLLAFAVWVEGAAAARRGKGVTQRTVTDGV